MVTLSILHLIFIPNCSNCTKIKRYNYCFIFSYKNRDNLYVLMYMLIEVIVIFILFIFTALLIMPQILLPSAVFPSQLHLPLWHKYRSGPGTEWIRIPF